VQYPQSGSRQWYKHWRHSTAPPQP